MTKNNRIKERRAHAISEILGTVLLLAIAVSLFSVIYMTLSSSLVIQESPQVNIIGYVEGNNLIFKHIGGSSLDSSIEFLITIGGQQQTFLLDTLAFSDTNDNRRWDIGECVYYSSSRIGGVFSVVVSVRDSASNSLLYNGMLQEGINDEQDYQEVPLIVYVCNDFNESTDGWSYDHFNDLQQGIDQVADNGIVYLLNGTYEGGYIISKSLSLIGESLQHTIIDANEEMLDGYVQIDSTEDVLLSTFTVCNGYIIPDDDEEDEGIYAAVISQNSSNITVTNIMMHDVNVGYASLEDISEIVINNLVVYNCSVGVGIRNGTQALFSNNHVSDCSIGLFIVDTESPNVLFENNTINNTLVGVNFINSNNTIVRDNIIQNAEMFGILFDFETDSNQNVIYNNQFVNNSVHIKDDYQNLYNITKTPGTNIIGGSYVAGNYYDDYTGYDLDDDGLGDIDLPYTSNGNIINGGDYHPLTLQTALSPVSHWEMDENSGCIAMDTYGSNDGTLEPNCPGTAPQWTQGISGSALSFDATQDSYVNIAYDDSLALSQNFSISFWIYPTSSTVQWRTFFTRQSQFTCSYIGGNKIRIHINGYTNIDSQSAAPRNSWTHVAFTLEDTDIGNDIIRLYINGELDGQIGPVWGTPGTPTNPLLIGGDGSSSFFTGRLDEISIYDRALTEEEVTLLYDQ